MCNFLHETNGWIAKWDAVGQTALQSARTMKTHMVWYLFKHCRCVWSKRGSSCCQTTWWFSHQMTRTNSTGSLNNCYKCSGRQLQSELVNAERSTVWQWDFAHRWFQIRGNVSVLHFHFYCCPFWVISSGKQRQV